MIDNYDDPRHLWIEDFKRSGFGMASIASGSMSPVLNVGDKVYVKFSDRSNYKIGDIIVFPATDSLMVHRIMGKLWTPKGKYVIHKGDHAGAKAGLVKQDQILGKPIVLKNDDKVIPVSSLPKPRTIILCSPFYSVLAMTLILRRMGVKMIRSLHWNLSRHHIF